jgi:hypothetical protein
MSTYLTDALAGNGVSKGLGHNTNVSCPNPGKSPKRQEIPASLTSPRHPPDGAVSPKPARSPRELSTPLTGMGEREGGQASLLFEGGGSGG